MRKSMLLIVGGLAAWLVCTSGTLTFAAEKGKKGTVETTAAQKSRGAGGADENIKTDSEQNNPDRQSAQPAPPQKGGQKSRGAYGCVLHVDNRTSLYIKLYANGDRVGTVSPYGDAIGYLSASALQLYAVADYTDGSRNTWGPRVTSCPGGEYSWQLTD